MLNTLVHKPLIHKGSQWVIYNATDVLVYERNGSPRIDQSKFQFVKVFRPDYERCDLYLKNN